ncbi:hypothetical protein HQ36_05430 [Porphyromonas gingivicanis]|uniref:Uncharacterized protein n=1 Tax=Porphyromonas gingivicanis TaxID=266762 RepID=A0A0A2GB88_9PORP|nr:hypothetical protein [Porphyromonas gingivicanis]KGN97714.1 hypothetical protein HQ36_05430 [Porphyromonas gingivicanis]
MKANNKQKQTEEEKSYKERWENVRKKLKGRKYYDIIYQYDKETWGEGINIFQERLDNYFFNSIEKIIIEGQSKGEGFAVVTLECAVIEMFSAFQKGLIFIPKNSTTPIPPKYTYGSDPNNPQHNGSKDMFLNFLYNASIFEGIFWKKNATKKIKDLPFSASDFYKNVRCGLMHEARTKDIWTINVKSKCSCDFEGKKKKLQEYKSLLTKKDKNNEWEKNFDNLRNTIYKDILFLEKNSSVPQIKVYRDYLFLALLLYLIEYSNKLQKGKEKGLRRKFARCMDHLFDFTPEDGGEWWK